MTKIVGWALISAHSLVQVRWSVVLLSVDDDVACGIVMWCAKHTRQHRDARRCWRRSTVCWLSRRARRRRRNSDRKSLSSGRPTAPWTALRRRRCPHLCETPTPSRYTSAAMLVLIFPFDYQHILLYLKFLSVYIYCFFSRTSCILCMCCTILNK